MLIDLSGLSLKSNGVQDTKSKEAIFLTFSALRCVALASGFSGSLKNPVHRTFQKPSFLLCSVCQDTKLQFNRKWGHTNRSFFVTEDRTRDDIL